MNSTRIAFFLPSLAGGGAERQMLNLARGVSEAGCEVDLVLAKAAGAYIGEIPEGVEVFDLAAGRVIAAVPGLARYLSTRQPLSLLSAIDHANISAIWAKMLARSATRVFVSVRSTLSVESARSARLGDRIMPLLARLFYPRASAVIAVSHGVADDLVENIGIQKAGVRVIHNPVVTPELSTQAREPLDHPWFADHAPPVILAAGRLTDQKAFTTLIHAFARVRAERPARLLVLGDGPQRAALEALVTALGLDGDVSMPGFADNPFPYMRKARLFVLSSAWEGLPSVLIQAMACGTPVVSTDCPSGPREILRNGRFGRLVPVGDEQALSSAIFDSLVMPSDPAILRTRAADFSLSAITHEYLDLLGNRR